MCNNYYFHKLWRGPRKSIIRSSGGPARHACVWDTTTATLHYSTLLADAARCGVCGARGAPHVPGDGPCVPQPLVRSAGRTQGSSPPSPSCRRQEVPASDGRRAGRGGGRRGRAPRAKPRGGTPPEPGSSGSRGAWGEARSAGLASWWLDVVFSAFTLVSRCAGPRARGVGLWVPDVAGRWRSDAMLLTPYTPFEDGRRVPRGRDYT